MSIPGPGGVGGTPSQITYLSMQSYKAATWMRMMAESFPELDEHRQYLATNGSWTARTASLARWAVVDTWA